MNTQVLRLNQQADVVQSYGQLLSHSSKCLPKEWLVIQSAWSTILKLKPGSAPLRIPFVHQPCKDLKGYYHLTFSCTSISPWGCQLTISCCTTEAGIRQRSNQAKNESSIRRSTVIVPT